MRKILSIMIMKDHEFVSLEFSSAKRTINPLPRYPDPTIVHSFVLTVYYFYFQLSLHLNGL